MVKKIVFLVALIIFFLWFSENLKNLKRQKLFREGGYSFVEGGVYKTSLGFKGGCRVYYLFEKGDVVYKGMFSSQKKCNGFFYGQKYRIKVAKSDPSYSAAYGEIAGKLKNIDSLAQIIKE